MDLFKIMFATSILKDTKVAIITGGWTGERNENIAIARNIEKTLIANDVNPKFIILDETHDILPQLKNVDVDFVFVSITEEVPIQPILDLLGIPFNGSSNMATSMSLNKKFIKIILEASGVNCPKDVVFQKNTSYPKIPFSYPYVVKPLRSGSSCGVSLAKNKSQLDKAIKLAFMHDSKILIEEYIDGQEVTIPVIGKLIMPGVKITSDSGIWDEERKNNLKVDLKVVTSKEKELNRLIKEVIIKMINTLELESFWRADAIYKNGKLYILEINTQPCMAGGKTGLLPTSCSLLDWSHFDFLTHIATEAINRKKTNYKHVLKIVD